MAIFTAVQSSGITTLEIIVLLYQTADPTAGNPNGPLLFVLLLGVILSVPVSVGLIWLYRRAVLKSMRTRVTAPAPAPPPPVSSTPVDPSRQVPPELVIADSAATTPAIPAARDLYAKVLRGPWRVAAIYAVAGACFAVIMTGASLVAAQLEFLPLRVLFQFWINVWPIVLTVNLVANTSRRAKIATVLVYFLGFVIVVTMVSIKSTGPVSGAPLAWLMFNAPPTLLLLAFLNRRVRAVGPLVLIFIVVALAGPQIIISIAASDERLLRLLIEVGHPLGLGARTMLLGLVLFGLLGAGPVGWLTLKWVRRRYERKQISDQSITLDAIWLLFGLEQSLMLASRGAVWILSGLVAFFAYKIVTSLGFTLTKTRANSRADNARLLLLRVFSLGKRSEHLFDALAKHWRHVGSIQLIAGTDLATDNLEPHEFLDFISAKLARRFIDAPQTLQLRMSEMDSRPDQDGRFRVNEFFSHDDTWKHVLLRLVSESDVVLMDLRGFRPENAGCVYEIAELINLVPLAKVQFIIDKTTNEPFLLHCMRQSWNSMRPASPNRLNPSAQLRLFRFTKSGMGQLRQLLHSLCIAARSA